MWVAFGVSLERVVCGWRLEGPDLERLVERGRDKGVPVLWVECDVHDVMGVSLEGHETLPALLPIPQLDVHVVGRGDEERQRRVDVDAPDVVLVRLKGNDQLLQTTRLHHLLVRVVVEDPDVEIVGSCDDPGLALDELARPDREVGCIECLDDSLA